MKSRARYALTAVFIFLLTSFQNCGNFVISGAGPDAFIGNPRETSSTDQTKTPGSETGNGAGNPSSTPIVTQPTSCRITLSVACYRHPQYTGTFVDDQVPAALTDQVSCLARAQEYHTWCGSTGQVKSEFMSGSTAVASSNSKKVTYPVETLLVGQQAPHYATFGPFQNHMVANAYGIFIAYLAQDLSDPANNVYEKYL